jgi:hypothetical protein
MANEQDQIKQKLAELDRLIDAQKARLAESTPVGLTGETLTAILASQAEGMKALVEQARPVRHSNPDHLHISAFSHPEGDLKRPKPSFIKGANGRPRDVFFNNHRESVDDLTPAEVDAYNAITHSCEAREGKWTAVVKANAVFITIPSFTSDDRQEMHNGLVLNLTELASGPKAVDLVDLVAEVAALRRQLASSAVA